MSRYSAVISLSDCKVVPPGYCATKSLIDVVYHYEEYLQRTLSQQHISAGHQSTRVGEQIRSSIEAKIDSAAERAVATPLFLGQELIRLRQGRVKRSAIPDPKPERVVDKCERFHAY